MRIDNACIFCGQPANTREHIPAKHFFKGIPDKNLITVPSCRKCNKGYQHDEDLFRQFWVSMLMDKSQKAKQLMENEISRSITRTPALGWQMFNQMQLVERYTPSGLYLGRGTAYHVSKSDQTRIDRVVEKIICGLFYNQFKQTIPNEWLINIYWITPKLEREQKLQELAKTLKWDVIKEDTFAYGFNFVPQTYQSVWIIDFFKIPLFYVLVLDKKTANKKKKRLEA